MMRLLIATYNPGKIAEYAQLLKDLPVELVGLAELGVELDVEETGATFAENALIKARTFAEVTGLVSLADDSGLEVDALDGAPGVLSARYAGPRATDQDRYRKLLEEMADVCSPRRTARFRCVIAVAWPDGRRALTEGSVEGVIACAPRGEHGFGYDPVFYLPERRCTMAELAPEVKNQISHRAEAARALVNLLERCLAVGDCQTAPA
jgi:XTP/dITP diphosphohydrolase